MNGQQDLCRQRLIEWMATGIWFRLMDRVMRFFSAHFRCCHSKAYIYKHWWWRSPSSWRALSHYIYYICRLLLASLASITFFSTLGLLDDWTRMAQFRLNQPRISQSGNSLIGSVSQSSSCPGWSKTTLHQLPLKNTSYTPTTTTTTLLLRHPRSCFSLSTLQDQVIFALYPTYSLAFFISSILALEW